MSTKSTGSEATPVIFTARHQRLASESGSFVVIAGSELGRRYPLPASEARIGRVSINEIVVDDRSISRTHARVFPTPEGFVIEDLASTNGILINEIATTRRILRDGDIIRIGRTVLKFLTNTNLEVDYHTEVYKLSTTDALSGCYNKRYLINQLERDLSRALRYKRSLSVILFDIDHFKLLNDTLGHIAGDAALVTVAQRVRDVIRRADMLARYGGEEFVVVAPEVDGPQAILIGEKLRLAIAERPILVGEEPTRLTVSVGVADMESYADAVRLRGEDPRTALPDPHLFLRLADERMYEAKQAGRNCVRYEPANR